MFDAPPAVARTSIQRNHFGATEALVRLQFCLLEKYDGTGHFLTFDHAANTLFDKVHLWATNGYRTGIQEVDWNVKPSLFSKIEMVQLQRKDAKNIGGPTWYGEMHCTYFHMCL